MPSYEQKFTDAGFKVLQRCVHEKPQQNLRDRADAIAKALNVAPEQITKAMALKNTANESAPPIALVLPTADRLDLALVSKVLGTTVDYFPQEKIDDAFGSPMTALSILNKGNFQVVADARIFDNENIVVSSGDPLIDVLVPTDDLRAYLPNLQIIDLESAKGGKGGIIEPRVLKGFRDYLPEEMLPRQAMIATITQVFERFGFAPLQTPALEYSDILLGKLGGDAEKLLFRFKDNGGRDICLRYDLTVPLARVAAQYPDLPKPFKRYQIAPVWRAEKPGRGRFREFFQCDCDIVGSASLLYDAECIALDFAVMQALGVNAEVRFNNRKVLALLNTFLNFTGADIDRRMSTVFRTIDKLPSQGRERVMELLKTDAACDDNQVDTIMKFVEISGSNEQMILQMEDLFGNSNSVAPVLDVADELRRVNNYVKELTASNPGSLKLDFSIARGLDYYTGTVYETFLTDLPGTGSVMSGGRYDGLIERYLGKPMPAVGISVGIDRLFSYLVELKRVSMSAVTSQVMVVAMDASCLTAALKTLGQFRAAGVAAEMAIENEQKPKMDKQLSLAGKKGIPFAAILGSNEVAKGTLMLKDLNARTQEELTVEAAIKKLKH